MDCSPETDKNNRNKRKNCSTVTGRKEKNLKVAEKSYACSNRRSPSPSSSTSSPTIGPTNINSLLQCHLCDERFEKLSLLRVHVLWKHPFEATEMIVKNGEIQSFVFTSPPAKKDQEIQCDIDVPCCCRRTDASPSSDKDVQSNEQRSGHYSVFKNFYSKSVFSTDQLRSVVRTVNSSSSISHSQNAVESALEYLALSGRQNSEADVPTEPTVSVCSSEQNAERNFSGICNMDPAREAEIREVDMNAAKSDNITNIDARNDKEANDTSLGRQETRRGPKARSEIGFTTPRRAATGRSTRTLLSTPPIHTSRFILQEGDEQQLSCPSCQFQAADKPTMKKHRLIVHESGKNSTGPWICVECSEKGLDVCFKSAENLCSHFRFKHELSEIFDGAILIESDVTPIACVTCGINFTDFEKVVYHEMHTHSFLWCGAVFYCFECNGEQVSVCTESAVNHMEKHGGNSCCCCLFRTNSYKDLLHHFENSHQDFLVKCKICSQPHDTWFKSRLCYYKHLQKVYKCVKCSLNVQRRNWEFHKCSVTV